MELLVPKSCTCNAVATALKIIAIQKVVRIVTVLALDAAV
jgi:hypothetical protein